MPKSLSGRHFTWNFSGHETNTASNRYSYFYPIAIGGTDISLDFCVRQHKEENDMMSLQVGESVVVKSGILDPDFSVEISGWQLATE